MVSTAAAAAGVVLSRSWPEVKRDLFDAKESSFGDKQLDESVDAGAEDHVYICTTNNAE